LPCISPNQQFARSDVLRVFNHAQIYLFLASAIITVGLLAASFSLLRRRFDALLLWFALFAILYGVRLEMNYQLLWTLGLRSIAFQRFVIAIVFLVPIPTLFYVSHSASEYAPSSTSRAILPAWKDAIA